MWPFRSKKDASKDAGGGVDTPAAAPTRQERKVCWDNRDAYFACLDKKAIVFPPGLDPIEDRSRVSQGKLAEIDAHLAEERANDPCAKLRTKYEGTCTQSWVCFCSSS